MLITYIKFISKKAEYDTHCPFAVENNVVELLLKGTHEEDEELFKI